MPIITNSKSYRKRQRKLAAEREANAACKLIEKLTILNDIPEAKPQTMSDAEAWANDACHKTDEIKKTAEELEKERVDEKLAGWPWDGLPQQLFTTSSFTLNTTFGNPYQRPEKPQYSRLLVFLSKNEHVCEKILHEVFENYKSSCNFANTCRYTWWLVGEHRVVWDMTAGFFNSCENDPYSPLLPGQERGRVPQVLVVTPVRNGRSKRDPVYDLQLNNLNTFCQAVGNFSDSFRNIQLHRVPFLDTDILTILIPQMRNLKHLGIFACPLINVGHTIKLLDIIKQDKTKEREQQVALDFFPAHHVGPIPIPGTDNYSGNYGATWDNWAGDTRIAIWSLVALILPQAKEQNVDFTSKNSMFRRWLELSPCLGVGKVLKALENENTQPETLVSLVNYWTYKGDVERLIDDISNPNRPEGYLWMVEAYKCGRCLQKKLGIFYFYDEIRWAKYEGRTHTEPASMKCLGCTLVDELENEADHFKAQKRLLLHKWVYDGMDANNFNLPKLLADFEDKSISYEGAKLNYIRIKTAQKNGYDREFEERQRPLQRREKGRHGIKYISPTYEDKTLFLQREKMTPEMREWSSINMDRLYGHGHGGLD